MLQELSTNSGAPRTLKTLFHTFESFPDQRVQLSIESSNSSSGSTAFDIISDIRIPQRENLEVSESPNIRSDFWQRYCTSELICKYCNGMHLSFSLYDSVMEYLYDGTTYNSMLIKFLC